MFNPGWLFGPFKDPQPSMAWNLLGLDPLPSSGPALEKLGVWAGECGASGLNKNQFCPHFKGRGRRHTDWVTGREGGVWQCTDPFCFSSQVGLSMKPGDRSHYPTLTRSALGLG